MISFKINSPLPLVFLSICLLWAPNTFSRDAHIVGEITVISKATPLQLAMLSPKAKSAVPEQTLKVEKPVEQVIETESISNDNKAIAAENVTPVFSDEEIAQLRKLFLQAEESLKSRDDESYFLLADQLKDYPLYPYLQYQWLKKNLTKDGQVKHFLEQYQSSRYASPLKRKWLHNLVKRNEWETYLEFYSASSDDKLTCYYHRAQYKTGDKETALKGAAKLWAVGKSQPKACDPLFAELKKSRHFNEYLVWKRFDAALKNNKISLASYVKGLMTPASQKTAQLWLNLHKNPKRYISTLLDQPVTEKSAEKFTHAINRLANNDIHLAIALWDKNKERFVIDGANADKLEKRLALKLSFKKDVGAYDRLAGLNEADKTSKTQRIDLSESDKNSEKWQYWLARSYLETDKELEAEVIFSELADKRDFYGYLAADRLDRIYQLSDNPIVVTHQALTEIKQRREFRVAFEFMVLERTQDAKLQWWHALRQLDKSEIPTAAKLAQQWQWDEIAIFTIAKVKQWDDIAMRFPMSYSEKIHENAVKQDLNPMFLFGLVRRESAFNKDAYSPVGARGLMQIMPNTGKQIARDLNERWTGKHSLNDPVKNLKYGSYYYQKLLNKFDGNYAIALAAYNAGPSRVKQWLPDEAIPADIWIETIPYRETRDYVTNVLVYSMIYQQRIQSDEFTMNDLTGEIKLSETL